MDSTLNLPCGHNIIWQPGVSLLDVVRGRVCCNFCLILGFQKGTKS